MFLLDSGDHWQRHTSLTRRRDGTCCSPLRMSYKEMAVLIEIASFSNDGRSGAL
jgi:hypothetical protein